MSATLFDRHPKKTIAVFLLVILIFFILMAEIFLRLTIPYDIGYYTAVKKPGRYEYPYGTITMNSLGYPDKEFNLESTKKRIGYFGDSVVFGVGVGEDYRLPDLLEKQYPQYEHWVLSMVGDGVQDFSLIEKAEKLQLDVIIYAMNLNDILPIIEKSDSNASKAQTNLFFFQNWIRKTFDGLRGKSYLYTSLRTAIKNLLVAMGYGHTGFKAAEFFPSENENLIKDVANRVNSLSKALNDKGIEFCVMILPYEMQISKDAAQTYANLGIKWEQGFESGSTQEMIKKYLTTPYLYDARKAFQEYIDAAKTGQFFVYNKGDKIDFNHPNRDGHALLAAEFVRDGNCPVFKP